MGRKRSQSSQGLPPYVTRSEKRGIYVFRPYLGRKDGKTRFGKEIILCGISASLAEVQRCYDRVNGKATDTLRWMLEQYYAGEHYKTKISPATRKKYWSYGAEVLSKTLNDGSKFGDVRIIDITPKVMQRYLDSVDAKILGNRQLQFMKAAFSWAVVRLEGVDTNACKGVRLNPSQKRKRYVTDKEYKAVIELARKHAPAYVEPAMEIAFLCRARKAEVLNLELGHLLEHGIELNRLKGSAGEITLYTPRLEQAVAIAKAFNCSACSPYLIHNKYGERIKETTFDTAWQRLMRKAMDDNVISERFTFHDLKAKGVTDHKYHAGVSEQMKSIYVRKLDEHEATR